MTYCKHVWIAVLVLGSAVVIPTTSGAQSLFYFWGEEGDWVSGGQEHYGSEATGTFSASRTPGNGVEISYDSDDPYWDFRFEDGDGSDLSVGVYQNAVRYPFNDPGEHGMAITGDHRGCNKIFGHFVVQSVSYNPDASVRSFAAEFEQDCEGGDDGPWLTGWVRFNSNLPWDINNAVDDSGFEDGFGDNWESDTWTTDTGDSHFGMTSAKTTQGGAITYSLPRPLERGDMEEVSFWLKQPAELAAGADLIYEDGTSVFVPFLAPKPVWFEYNVTEHLRDEGRLVGVRIYGASSTAGPVETYLDDLYVKQSAEVFLDAFESGDLTAWDASTE